MEREIIMHPGTPLFVRPLHDGTWVPMLIDHGVLTGARLRKETFNNRD